MDDMARATSREDADLASIVLGRTTAGDRRIDAPERVPTWFDGAPERGYDARSVVVLALVVAVLAAVVGWSTTIGDTPTSAGDAATASSPTPDTAALGDALGVAATAVERSTKAAAEAPAARGANLAAGRLVASRSGSGAGLVTVTVRNGGDVATAATGAEVLVLADGDVMGTARIGALAAGAATSVEVPLGWCPAGTVALVAMVDPGSAVSETSEFDNAVSRSASFGC